MSRPVRGSFAARREQGGGRLGMGLLALAALVASGCVATPTLPIGSGGPTTPPSTSAAAGRSPDPAAATATSLPAATPEPSPIGAPTALPGLEPSPLSLTRFTVVCEDWGPDVPAPAIDCGEAVALALAAIGPETAASTRRLDFSFGDRCDRGVPCPERRPDVGRVIARSATFDTLRVRVAIGPTGELGAWPPLPGPAEAPPAFAAPPNATPDLGAGLPAELRDRRPAPFCGAEDLTASDAFDTTARTCFLGGVLAGVPVELVSRSFSTEGQELLTLYRFAGRGAVLRYVRTPAGWTGSACGISPIGSSVVFALAGRCERLTL